MSSCSSTSASTRSSCTAAAPTSPPTWSASACPCEFVGGLRVSDPATVEVAKMVLVGKVNKEIVLRLGRHGQPAVGLCGDDGSLFRIARRAAPGRSGHRLRRLGRARQRRRAPPRRARLHPRDRLGRLRPRGQLLQRQRRRGRWRGRGRARRLQGRVPHRCRRLARRPAGPRQPDRPGQRRARSTRGWTACRVACAPSSPPAWRRSTAASTPLTSSTGASLIRCCSSCSPTQASAPRSRPRDRARRHASQAMSVCTPSGVCRRARQTIENRMLSLAGDRAPRDSVLRALPGRVRARRGLASVGRRRASSTSTSSAASR